MDLRLLITIIGLPIYLTAVIALRRYKQWLVYYLMAAFGLTLLLTLIAEHFGWDAYLINIETFHTGLVGQFLHIPADILTSGRLILAQPGGGGSAILKLGIECSGILEIGVLIGLLLFYPAFHWQEKIFKLIFGLACTYAINIARMLIIVAFVWWLGPDWTYVGHAVVGRLFFFILAMVLYWFILTKPTLKVVGEAAKDRLLASDISQKPGRAYVLRRRYMAGTTLLIVLGFGSSFVFSSQWHKAFGPIQKMERPIIYPAETTAYPVFGDEWQELSGMPEAPKMENGIVEIGNWKEEKLEIGKEEGKVLGVTEEQTDVFSVGEMPQAPEAPTEVGAPPAGSDTSVSPEQTEVCSPASGCGTSVPPTVASPKFEEIPTEVPVVPELPKLEISSQKLEIGEDQDRELKERLVQLESRMATLEDADETKPLEDKIAGLEGKIGSLQEQIAQKQEQKIAATPVQETKVLGVADTANVPPTWIAWGIVIFALQALGFIFLAYGVFNQAGAWKRFLDKGELKLKIDKEKNSLIENGN